MTCSSLPCRETLAEGVEFYSLRDDRFKTARLTAALLLPMKEQTAAAGALLPHLLRSGCEDYPTLTALNGRLGELYGARITADVSRIGEIQALTLTAVSLEDRFAFGGEPVTAECAALMRSLLFDPARENGVFPASAMERERRCLIERIQAEINDKRLYARRRCNQLLCEGDGYAVPLNGTVEEAAALTAEAMTAFWREALRTARVIVICQGSGDHGAVKEAFRQGFAAIDRVPVSLSPAKPPREQEAVRRVTERLDVNQSKLVMGLRAPVTASLSSPEEVAAMRLMNALLGGTPHSLLFQNVREKMSLCYYCASSYDRHKGVFLIDSGVEETDAARAEEAVLEQLDRASRGDFTRDDLESARLSVKNQFLSLSDLPSTLEGWYLGQAATGLPLSSPEQAAAETDAVTAEQTAAAARSLTLQTVFLLAGTPSAL